MSESSEGFRINPERRRRFANYLVDVSHFGDELGTTSESRGVVEMKRNDGGGWFQRRVALEPMWGEKDIFLRA
jgi:hypothetical protein